MSEDEVTEGRQGLGARIGRRLRPAVLPLLFLACCGYFVWHAIHGERGLIADRERAEEIVAALAERDAVRGDVARMERRVEGLRGEQLDPDQLEERARQLLNMVGRDEVVVLYGEGRELF